MPGDPAPALRLATLRDATGTNPRAVRHTPEELHCLAAALPGGLLPEAPLSGPPLAATNRPTLPHAPSSEVARVL